MKDGHPILLIICNHVYVAIEGIPIDELDSQAKGVASKAKDYTAE